MVSEERIKGTIYLSKDNLRGFGIVAYIVCLY